MQFQFSTLKKVKAAGIVEVFNSAFADYFVKIELTEMSLADKILAENIILEKSVGAFVENKLVGFILLGIENGVAYNGGTGVILKARGNSLTGKMYEFILPKLNAEGIYSHQLEVVTENFPAIKIYEKIGFETFRALACFRGKITISKINRDIEIKDFDEIDETLFSQFWNSNPSWQNSISAIKRTKYLHKIVGAFYENNLVGYLIYTETGRIKQFAVKKEFRHSGIAQTLFAQLSNPEIIITNVDKRDYETISFLEKLGLNPFLEQFEMKFSNT
ncbi:MAG TPA: GNAT family N-acetyltransferase [Pyrinomonadaceae bacterium]|nr:GNAT family N-acetyltransferase [Pyrinomonadaceae bacterium]